ncbi:MAG: hypothetical protein ACYTKD_16210 [Planctomycetota bacterium]|jgi:hypothetical protein
MGRSGLGVSLILASVFLAGVSHGGQVGDRTAADRLLAVCMDHVRRDRSTPIVEAVVNDVFGSERLVPFLEAHLDDPSPWARSWFRWWLGDIGLRSKVPALRQRVVESLVAGLERDGHDRDRAVRIYKQLRHFLRDDFSGPARERLVKLLASRPRSTLAFSVVILVIGIADIKSQIPTLGTFLTESKKYEGGGTVGLGPPSWAARKARARMGVSEDIRFCIRVVEAEPDPNRRIGQGLSDLSYIRQPEIMVCLHRYLEDDNRFVPPGWEERSAKYGPPTYAVFAVVALGKMMRDFPVRKDYAALVTKEDIEVCRRWMAGRTGRDIIGYGKAGHQAPEGPGPEDEALSLEDQDTVTLLLRAYAEVLADRTHVTMGDLLVRAYGAAIIPYLDAYSRDGSRGVRSSAYEYLGAIGLNSDDPAVKQAVTKSLCRGMADAPIAIGVYDALVASSRSDFSDSSRDALARILEDPPADPHSLDALALVVGVADVQSQLPRLKEIVLGETAPQGSKEWWKSPGWAAMRARARMGVDEDIERCIELVEAEPNTERRLRILFPELSYVRRRQVVEYMRRYLDSDRRFQRVFRYSTYAIRCLGEMLRGFPIKEHRQYSKDDVTLCREWMAAYDLVR